MSTVKTKEEGRKKIRHFGAGHLSIHATYELIDIVDALIEAVREEEREWWKEALDMHKDAVKAQDLHALNEVAAAMQKRTLPKK